MAIKAGKPKSNNREKLSFKKSFAAWSYLVPFFKMVWNTSKSLTLANILSRLVKAALPLAMLYVGKLIIDEVILQVAAEEKVYTLIWQYLIIEFILALASDGLNRLISLFDALLGDLFSNKSSEQLIEKAASLDLAQFEDPGFYDKLERARRQTTGRVILMSQVFSQVQDIITVIFLAIGLVVFEPWLIVLLIIAILPSFLNESYFSQTGYSLVRSWTPQRRELDYLRYIGANDTTAKEIKIFGLSNFIKNRFAELADKYYHANKKLAIKKTIWGSVFHVIGDAAYYGAYVLIVFRTIAGILTVGDLTFLAGSFNRMRNQLQTIFSRFSKITESALYLKDYFEFLQIEPTIVELDGAKAMKDGIKEGFTFENVGFKYPGTDKWAVRGITFFLKKGEKLALVGENGAGKTTLVKLLARLYDPTEGRILLDGVDIKKISLEDYRNNIGVIFQDFVRFYFIASENIAVGNIDLKEDKMKIKDSAYKSLADELISKMPAQYEQMLGKRFEGGIDLSGGEWQKVALARAYMRDAQLMILDEPTAALDARAEYEVFKRFTELTSGRTAVIISHRFSTVRMADRILVLKGGMKEELGSHKELLASEGLYAELFNLQAQGYL